MIHSKTKLSGIFLMIKASFAFSLMALCVKLVSQSIPSLEVVFFRSLIGTALMAGLIYSKKDSFLGKEHKLMLLRALSGFTALSLHFYTISKLPLGTAVLLNYTGPIFAAIFAFFFLKEKISFFRAVMILVSFAGVWLLVNANLGTFNFTAFLALLSAVFVGIVYVSIRALRKRESPLTIIFYFTAVSTVGSLAFLPFGFEWPKTWQEWLLLAGVGAGSFYGQLWMTIAIRRAPASLVSPFSYLTPLLSFLYGLIFWGEALSGREILGAFLIIAAGCLISYFETKNSLIKEA